MNRDLDSAVGLFPTFENAAGPIYLGEEAFSVSYPREEEFDLRLVGDRPDTGTDIDDPRFLSFVCCGSRVDSLKVSSRPVMPTSYPPKFAQ